jgi:hypothetical protein
MSLVPSGSELRRFVAVVGASSCAIWGATAAAISAPGGAMTAAVTVMLCLNLNYLIFQLIFTKLIVFFLN